MGCGSVPKDSVIPNDSVKPKAIVTRKDSVKVENDEPKTNENNSNDEVLALMLLDS